MDSKVGKVYVCEFLGGTRDILGRFCAIDASSWSVLC